jgi:hypothetical protein
MIGIKPQKHQRRPHPDAKKSQPKAKGRAIKLDPLRPRHFLPYVKSSDCHNLFFLRLEQILDPLDLCIRQLLHLIVSPLFIVS